ncbi:tetratricopeptide (TPR) repeat protein [Bradyrhizobium sp. CIR48]|uniref:ATP-binding protein n=1 Tax=Bradyrhizobium sp. CIR48 TaxID=2663840 RepID=UPI001606F19C|nr:ATP-binding protein [Bradyrhizobium sp. CIR48]MBB4423957.1 tetratricopeptide (TPR) repeat protein [Bradyrhizobium sp. CIR48]
MSSSVTRSTSDVVAELQKRTLARSNASMDLSSSTYLFAAAVLHVFSPSNLKPWLPLSSPINPAPDLFGASVVAVGWRHLGLRTLKPEERRSALSFLWKLGGREILRSVLAANPDRLMTPIQRAFDKWLAGDRSDLSNMSFDDLVSTGQLYDWGIAEFGGLPDRAKFDVALRRRSAVSLFEHLVDDSFVGREEELQILRDYVGVVEPSLWQRLRGFVGPGSRPPLVLYGPGGVGKTALIGKFLLEHVNAPTKGWFPFAYLPFDSSSLDVSEPFTILVAASTQLSAQINDEARSDRSTQEFSFLVSEYRDERAQLRQRASNISAQQERLANYSGAEERLYVAFGRMLERIASAAGRQQKAGAVPVVLVFDTFEEVYYRTKEDLFSFWQMLAVVQKIFPSLRVIIAGRAKPNPFTVKGEHPEEHSLGDLNQQDATRLLSSLGVDGASATVIARQIGGSPLSLRLAARIAQSEDASRGITGLQTKRYWLFDVAPEVVQGSLYTRVLDHIHDEDVRALAHPGMVLRRVTKEIIRFVLAPLCKVTVLNDERAEELFEELRREHTLVSIEDDDALRYREEIRRPVLLLMKNQRPDQVRTLQSAAVHYYETEGETLVERAEEIYHRLMLHEDSEVIATRWLSGVEQYLTSAIADLEPEQQIWLAERMSIELPADVYDKADLSSWERLIGRKALETFRFAAPDQVLALVRQRSERTSDSPLFAIEARALLALNRTDEAERLLERALDGYPLMANRGRLAELLWLQIQVNSQRRRADDALDLLVRLREVSDTLRSPLPSIQTLTETIIRSPESAKASLRLALVNKLALLGPAEIDKERSLIRLALVSLGVEYPQTIAKLLPLVVHDFYYLMRRSRADIEKALRSPVVIENLAPHGLPNDPPTAALQRILEYFISKLIEGEQEPQLVEAIIMLLRLEEASLSGANLGGLDEYRESWELNVVTEVAI